MPLFHIHGLVAALLASLDARARSVACTPGFHQLRFFEWLDELDADLVHGGPDHARGRARARTRPAAALGRHRLRFDPLVLGRAPRARSRGARGGVRRAGDRGLRHDRGRPSDRVQPAAARRPEAGHGRPADRARGRDPRPRRRSSSPAGEIGEVAIRGASVFAGYEANPEANEAAFTGRLVPDRRRGLARRRRLPDAARADQGDHQPRRREDLPARGRRRAAAAPRRRSRR